MRRAPQFQTCLIVLYGMGEVAKLVVKPPQRVHQATADKPILPLLRFGHPFAPDGERLGILPHTPMGETEKGEGEQFAQAIVDIPRYHQPLLPERNGARKMSLPVGMRTQPQEVGGEGVLVALLTADLQGCLELPVALPRCRAPAAPAQDW